MDVITPGALRARRSRLELLPLGKAAPLSLVMCTRNRAETLARALAAVAQMRVPLGANFEFILVDNGSTDATPATFERAAATFAFPAKYVFEPAPGVGNALNRGYRESKGAIVAFTDDDCYPAEDFLETALRAFDDPRVGVVTGRILLHDPDDAPLTINESRAVERYQAGRYVRPGQFTGANLSFRRAALDGIGGFDPLFGPGSYIGSGADCDAASRVCLEGWDGRYDPAILVRHHHGRKEADSAALQRRYAIGSGAYHMKLLLEHKQGWHFVRYLAGLPGKLRRRPSTLYWEAIGALRFIRRPPRATAAAEARQSAPSPPNGVIGLFAAFTPALFELRHMTHGALSWA
jgi:glycosyltransferase involved in cell wall biosynthesis